MNTKKKTLDLHGEQRQKRYLILLGITVAFLLLYAFTIPNYVSLDTVTNLLRQSCVLGILSCGMTFVILTGGIDLSVGSNIAITGAITAMAMNATGGGTPGAAAAGFMTALFVGTLVGALNGALIGYLNITPFMATLATMSLGRGLTLYLTNSTRIVVNNDYFNYFGSKSIDVFGFKLPAMVLLLAAVVILSFVLLNKSKFGRKTYIIGGNPTAARATGINSKLQTLCVYAFMGLLVGVATIITIGRATSAQPLAATGTEFDVITAVVLGGITLAGGAGTLGGSMLGTLLMGVMLMGINMIDIPVYYNYIIKGGFVLFAVLADQVSTSYAVHKEIKLGARRADPGQAQADTGEVQRIGDFQTLTFSHVSKYFPGVQALSDVTFEIKAGTVHALTGENGAGKSTLMKVLSGVNTMDSGEILVDGKRLHVKSPQDSRDKGIAIIYQELTLISELSVAQNVFLGKEKRAKIWPFIAVNQMKSAAKSTIEKFGITIDPAQKAASFSVGKQQMIEIARAFDSSAKVVVMDEPTSAISESDKEILFDLIRKLKAQGVAIIYISHRIQELFEIADEVTVLRDGKHIVTKPIREMDEESMVRYMVNRDLGDVFSRERVPIGQEVLRVEQLGRNKVFQGVSFAVGAGEVLGMAGLIGAGRTEVARCVFGLDHADVGEIYLDGKKLHIHSPRAALDSGIGYVSEDRRREGIVPLMSVRENISTAVLDEISKFGIIDTEKEAAVAAEYIHKFNIKTPSDLQPIGTLSGGNQQKCCLGRMFAKNPKLIIFDEPTRGVDVGAKAEIHKLIESLAKDGIAIILISSELPEILGVSDRVLIMAEGHITSILDNNNLTQAQIMACATQQVSDKTE